ncbi:NmrA family NAD(P)-binding protein [Rhizobium skierniewicense]|uniref:SDR family oxidoreductase n=1 Tax=Rhizobium skierniewicense TaxID=984260 RepID=UPI001FADEA2B|nr:NmrA family NAD(P)-binding protein [Rhizobium skierniewicense]MCI9868706.1 NmrA family NAD(P)-binding protein [Rhizobium skierniewicense]
MKNVLVVGATGPQGRAVAEKLIDAGVAVRVMAREPRRADDLATLGAQVVQGDLDDPISIAAAMEGQDGVFLTIPFFNGSHAQGRNVIDAAAKEGVRRIVWNVAGRIQEEDIGNPAIDKWRPILTDMKASGVPFTVLQPTVYMENFLNPAIIQEVRDHDILAYPMPSEAHTQWISHQDAAAYTASAFQHSGDDSMVIDVSGPEDLTGGQIAERFSQALGRSITFRPMPPEEFATTFPDGMDPEPIVRHYTNVFANPEMMTSHVDHKAALAILKIEPLSFETWVRNFRDAFTRS